MQGLINLQFAVCQDEVYIIEANPRASRTVPFVAKATGVPLAKLAGRLADRSLEQLGLQEEPNPHCRPSKKPSCLRRFLGLTRCWA